MAVAVFRRYTPPTCTLELRGERSPLSVWSDRPIVKQVQFILSIDGPQRPVEQRITIKGGRTQLDHLHDVVNGYVQQTLNLSASQFQTRLLHPQNANPRSLSEVVDAASLKELGQLPDAQFNTAFEPTPTAAGQGLAAPGRIRDIRWSRSRSRSSSPRSSSSRSSSPKSSMTLIPKGLLKHELQLGDLAPNSANASTTLNTTELFDLVHALEAYKEEVDSIPELNPAQRRGVTPWMKGAAAAVLAVGVTATLVNVLELTPNASFESADSQLSDLSNEQELAQRPTTLELPPVASSPTASDDELLSTLDKTATDEAEADSLAGSDSPGDDIVAEAAQASNEAAPSPEGDSQEPDSQGIDSQEANSQDPKAIAQSQPENRNQPNRNRQNGQRRNSGNANSNSNNEVALLPAAPGQLPAPISGSAATRPQAQAPTNSTLSRSAVANPSAPSAAVGTAESIDPALAQGSVAQGSVTQGALEAAELPSELTSIPPIPSIESGIDPFAASGDSADMAQVSGLSDRDTLNPPNASSEPKQPQLYTDNAETQRTQVQAYFESEWQPPEALNQALQFRLLFNEDGSLQQAIPLGESARSYRSDVNLPASDTPFVAPFSGNDTPPMRLFLGANGQVRVFLESLD